MTVSFDISTSSYLRNIPLLRGLSSPIPLTEFYKRREADESSIFWEFHNNFKTLSNVFEFKNPDEIRKFILQNRELVEVLLEGVDEIYRIFGSDIRLQLELHNDPEEKWDELFIVIKSSYTAREAVELERKVFNEWFVYVMDKVNNKLNFIEERL